MKNIVIQSKYLSQGLFGQILTWLLEILPLLDQYNLRPIFIIRTKNYGSPENDYNIFPDIIELNYSPKKDHLPHILHKYITKSSDDTIYLNFEKIKFGHSYKYMNDFKKANQCFNKFFRLKANLMESVKQMIPDNFVLGIHYRGTDRINDPVENPNQITDENLFKIIDSLIKKYDVKYMYLASDSEKGFNMIKDKYSGLQILHQEMTRSPDNKSIHGNKNYNNKIKADSAIFDSYALSKCNYVLSTNSALSSWAKIWNPELKIRRLQHFPQIWFPIAYIKMYEQQQK